MKDNQLTNMTRLAKISFMQFLEAKFNEEYIGLQDDAPDAFESWLADLDVQDIIEYAEQWGYELENR